jgi:hypothetical protein
VFRARYFPKASAGDWCLALLWRDLRESVILREALEDFAYLRREHHHRQGHL